MSRRRMVRGLFGAGALAFAGRGILARAQGSGGGPEPQLSVLPRVALVIGNSRYPQSPLQNPGNDASAIGAQLKQLKFDVTLKLDARRQEMIDAIRSYGDSLRNSKAVGLFYFAGHGAQLAWRNYLIPVDAAVNSADELLAQAVDMNSLLDDLIRARNPMNIIILDACRDNPFGSKVALAQHGLSQLDAPPGTMLAYATSPGSVAADGAGPGVNGLYTGFLLKEMQAREAKIEDVFKRVRLNVRRLSKGRQIPWESTSLEQDFYFYPAVAARKLTPEEQERQFEEELEIWQRIRTATDPSQFEDYLRRFPSGKFSELAQFRLDRLLARQGGKPGSAARSAGFVRVAASEPLRVAVPAANPYTRGTARADADYQAGDRYAYSKMDAYSRVEENRFEERVTEVTDFEVTYNRGRRVTDLLGNDIIARGGTELSPSQIFVYEYSVGKKWTTRFHVVKPDEGKGKGRGRGKGRKGASADSREDDVEIEFRVTGKERISLPSGTFDAFRVEGNGFMVKNGVVRNYVYWIAPERVRRVLAMELLYYASTSRHGKAKRADRFELVAYSERRGGTAAA